MFERFIQYYKDQGKLHPKFEFGIEQTAKFYESISEETKKNLQRIKEKYAYENRGKFEFDSKLDIHLEFWRGSGSYGTSVCLSSNEGVGDWDEEFSDVVKELYDVQSPQEREEARRIQENVKVDEDKFPPVFEMRFEETYNELVGRIYYSWFAFLWQEIKGYECRMPTKIVENNSVTEYSLNDFNFDEYSKYTELREKPWQAKRAFQRNLTLEELFLRSYQYLDHWTYQNLNSWRYFEKDGEFLDLGFYGNYTGIRKGKIGDSNENIEIELKEWDERKEVLSYMFDFVDKQIKDGWYERLRPSNFPKKLFEDALEFQTTYDWNGAEKDFSEDSILAFEVRNKFKIPRKFRSFIRLIDGKKNTEYKHFAISNTDAKQIIKIYSLAEIEENVPEQNLEYLKVMEVENGEFICININPSVDKNGGVFLQNAKNELEGIANNFEDFLSLLCYKF